MQWRFFLDFASSFWCCSQISRVPGATVGADLDWVWYYALLNPMDRFLYEKQTNHDDLYMGFGPWKFQGFKGIDVVGFQSSGNCCVWDFLILMIIIVTLGMWVHAWSQEPKWLLVGPRMVTRALMIIGLS